jgi:hypothetical protein
MKERRRRPLVLKDEGRRVLVMRRRDVSRAAKNSERRAWRGVDGHVGEWADGYAWCGGLARTCSAAEPSSDRVEFKGSQLYGTMGVGDRNIQLRV